MEELDWMRHSHHRHRLLCNSGRGSNRGWLRLGAVSDGLAIIGAFGSRRDWIARVRNDTSTSSDADMSGRDDGLVESLKALVLLSIGTSGSRQWLGIRHLRSTSSTVLPLHGLVTIGSRRSTDLGISTGGGAGLDSLRRLLNRLRLDGLSKLSRGGRENRLRPVGAAADGTLEHNLVRGRGGVIHGLPGGTLQRAGVVTARADTRLGAEHLSYRKKVSTVCKEVGWGCT